MNLLVGKRRPAEAGQDGELDAVMAVMEDAFDPQFGEGWSRTQCGGMLNDRNSWVDIVHFDEEPAGFALSRMIVDEAELLLIAVRPGFRGRGIGRELLERNCREAAARGATRLHLEVREGNEAARLYQVAGFEQIGRRRDYYRGRDGNLFDAITLALDLTPQNA